MAITCLIPRTSTVVIVTRAQTCLPTSCLRSELGPEGPRMAKTSGNKQSDRHCVLAAIKEDWRDLEVTGRWREDRDIEFAAETCRGGRDIVQLCWQPSRKMPMLSGGLLMSCWGIAALQLKPSKTSICFENLHEIRLPEEDEGLITEGVLQECCEKLGVSSTGLMCLVSGDDALPARTVVNDWPGIRASGEISEYRSECQLVTAASSSAV
eukprot:5446221-Amphidinium_carterae.1